MLTRWCLILCFAAAAGTLGTAIARGDSGAPPVPSGVSTPPDVQATTLFMKDEGGYARYRIPSLIVTERGTLLAFCEGHRLWTVGPRNDCGEVNITLRRSTDNGKTFSPRQVVWADGLNTCDNCCPVIDHRTGDIVLLLTHTLGEDLESAIRDGTSKGTRTVWITTSNDDGLTWSPPREITDSVKKPEWTWYATGPGIGIQIQHGPHAGRLVVPCDHVVKGEGRDAPNSHVIYSDDDGKTWNIGGEPTNRGFNESQVVELDDGRVMLNMRRDGSAKLPAGRGVAISSDGGETFGPGNDDPVLSDSHCEASILRYSWAADGKSRILFSNPAAEGVGASFRRMLTIRLSTDEAKTWPVHRLLYPGWTGYSCLARLADGAIGILYEAGNTQRYERIDFARFNLDWLNGDHAPRP